MMCRTSIFALLAAATTFAAEGDIVVNASVDSRIGTAKVTAGIQSMTLTRNGTDTWSAWKVNTAYTPEFTNVDTGYTAKWTVTKSGQTTLSGGAGNSINLSGDYAGCALSFSGEANEYTVMLYQQPGGGGTSSVRAKYDQQMPTPIGLPTRTGYTFNGYCADPNGGLETRYYTSGGSSVRLWKIASDTTLYAWWSATEYTVTLDKQNGSGDTSSVRATYDQQMPTLIDLPTRTGYTFNGYCADPNGGFETRYYTSGGSSVRPWDIASATTLYAWWTAKASTVYLDKQSGSNGTSSVTATYNQTMPSATMPTRTGYSFGGYYSATGGSGTQYYTAAGASARNWDKTNSVVTLYAKWSANTNTVTLDQQGGSGGSTSVSATYDVAMPSATMPSRTGYTFDGYYTGQNGSGTQYYTASGGSAENWHETSVTRLYAKWTANTYTVTFDANGGSVSPATTNVTYGSTYGNLPTPTFADHSFAGWFTAQSGGEQVTSSTGVSITDDQTLYARWTRESYEVQYNAFDKNGESIGGNCQNIGMGVSTYLTSFNDLSIRLPDGYSFKNWNTALDGSGVSYEDHANVFNLTNVANTTVMLYAQWEPNPYQVAFQPNGADGGETMTNQWFTYDVTQSLDHVAFTYAGRDFKGWSTVSNNPSEFYPDGAEVANLTTGGVVNLYANWTNIVYTVAFDANGGVGEMDPLTCTYTVPTNLPACAFTRDGWGFKGWTNSLAEGVLFLDHARVTNLTTRAEEVQMYACWTGETYQVVLDARDPQGEDNGVFTNSQDEAVSVWTNEYTVGDAWVLPTSVTNVNKHYLFAGWKYVDAQGETNGVPDVVPPPSAGVTNLVASWSRVEDALALAVESPGLDFDTFGTVGSQGHYDEGLYPADWFVQTEVTSNSPSAVQSGPLPKTGAWGVYASWMTVKVKGSGVLSFWWKCSAPARYSHEEQDQQGHDIRKYYGDAFYFGKYEMDGGFAELTDALEGVTNWCQVVYTNETDEAVTFAWKFQYHTYNNLAKGGGTGWVDRVTWVPDGATTDFTDTHKVPFSWLQVNFSNEYVLAEGNRELLDDLAETNSPNNKVWSNGEAVKVWQDYWAGTDPYDPNDLFRALIAVTNNVPYISWQPDLSVTGDPKRVYQVLCAPTPSAQEWVDWPGPGDSGASTNRFFKVELILEEE